MFSKYIKLTLLAGTLLFVSSCAKEEPLSPSSSSDTRDKFIGQWACTETSQSAGTTNFYVGIGKSTGSGNEVFIENFYNLGTVNRVFANVSGNNISIPAQVISGNTVSGNGTMVSTNQINLSYVVNDGSSNDNCSAILTK